MFASDRARLFLAIPVPFEVRISPVELQPIALPVHELLVMESHLLPEHSVHTELARVPLRAP